MRTIHANFIISIIIKIRASRAIVRSSKWAAFLASWVKKSESWAKTALNHIKGVKAIYTWLRSINIHIRKTRAFQAIWLICSKFAWFTRGFSKEIIIALPTRICVCKSTAMGALIRVKCIINAALTLWLLEGSFTFSTYPIQEGKIEAKRTCLLICDKGAWSTLLILPDKIRA